MRRTTTWLWRFILILLMLGLLPARALAAEFWCDASYQDWRAPRINFIREGGVAATVGFDNVAATW